MVATILSCGRHARFCLAGTMLLASGCAQPTAYPPPTPTAQPLQPAPDPTAWPAPVSLPLPASRPASDSAPSTVVTDGSLVFTQNMAEARVLFIDPVQNTRVVDLWAGDALPIECKYPDGSPACFLIGGHHTLIDDHDFVEFSAIRLETSIGVIARVPVTDPTRPVWRLTRFDFTGVPSNGACTIACGEGAPTIPCSPYWVHEFIIADEDPRQKWIDLILADMLNSRIVKVHLDYRNGNSCGQVLWVIDSSNPDWPTTLPFPNGVQLVDGPEGHFLITTLLSEDSVNVPGGSRVLFWSLDTEQPTLVWQYPEDDGDDALPYINASHHALIETDPITAQRFLLYGHSLGVSDEWNAGLGGSFGIAALDDLRDPPVYMADWTLPEGWDALRFTRELEVLSDGTFQGVDAGCYFSFSPDYDCPARIFWFRPAALPGSILTGAYSPEHLEQNIVPLQEQEISGQLKCGLELLFEADLIEPDMMGQELRDAQAAGGTTCPAD